MSEDIQCISPRIAIMKIDLTPDTQSTEAQDEILTLLTYLDSLQKKEAPIYQSSSLYCLYDYYKKSVEERATLRLKIEEANIGHNIANHMHLFYKITEAKSLIDQETLSVGSIDLDSIIGYISYYDDGSPYNPVIYIEDRFVISEFRSKGFYRSVLYNLIGSYNNRVPLFRTDILTESRDDIDLFVSLGFIFVAPHTIDPISYKDTIKLSNELIKEVKETDKKIESLIEDYKSLLHPEFKVFLMVLIKNVCHSCLSPSTEQKKLSTCVRCRSVFYCSPECQKKAWYQHKKVCSVTRLQ